MRVFVKNMRGEPHNDAIAISGMTSLKENENSYFILSQARKKKRSLHEATPRKGRNRKNTEAKRNNKNVKSYKGFFLNDRIIVDNTIGWISGFCNYGCYVQDIKNNYITLVGKDYKQVALSKCKLLNRNNSWRFAPHVSTTKVIGFVEFKSRRKRHRITSEVVR